MSALTCELLSNVPVTLGRYPQYSREDNFWAGVEFSVDIPLGQSCHLGGNTS